MAGWRRGLGPFGPGASVHGEVFATVRPASTMVVVSALLDERWVVEVELDAIVKE